MLAEVGHYRMDVAVQKKKFTLLVLLGSIVAAGLTFGVSPVMAAPVVDQTQSGLTGSTAQASLTTDGAGVISFQEDTGNSFTAGLSGSLTSIVVPFGSYSSGFPAFDVQATVWNVNGFGLPTGAALATQTIPGSSITIGPLTINFTAPATVTAGTRYVFLIGFINKSGPFSSTMGFSSGNAPADKHAVYAGTLSPYVDATKGINFTTYVDAAPAPGGSGGEQLPNTGANESDTSIWFGVSGSLLATGAFVLVLVRRRLAGK